MRTRSSAWIFSGVRSVTHLRNSAGEPARVRDRPDEVRLPGCLGRRLTPDCWGRVGFSQGDGGAERIRLSRGVRAPLNFNKHRCCGQLSTWQSLELSLTTVEDNGKRFYRAMG